MSRRLTVVLFSLFSACVMPVVGNAQTDETSVRADCYNAYAAKQYSDVPDKCN